MLGQKILMMLKDFFIKLMHMLFNKVIVAKKVQ